MRLPKFVLLAALAFLGAKLCAEEKLPDGLYAEFVTPHGSIAAKLLADDVPMTVTNFVGLAEGTLGPKKGQPYYTGLKWYRVVPGFVVQSGNPHHPGEGDAGDPFPDEFKPGLRHDRAGILSMANGGPDTNSAEFFITLADQTRLNYLHTVFGRVVSGVDLLSQIKPDETFSIRILRIGSVARKFKADETTLKALVAKAKPYRGLDVPGPTANFDDPEDLLPTSPPRAQGFNYKLANFERATGIKIVARMFSKEPPAEEDKVPGAYMRALAEKFGVAKRGAFVAYFAAEDDWRLWVGDESTAAFMGRPTTAKDLVLEGAFHDTKEAFFKAAQAAGDAMILAQQKAAGPDRPVAANQKLKLQTDALLDSLIFKLEPR